MLGGMPGTAHTLFLDVWTKTDEQRHCSEARFSVLTLSLSETRERPQRMGRGERGEGR